MNNIDDKYPQFVRIDSDAREKYLKPLVDTQSTLFYGRELTDVYFMSVALGFKFKARIKSRNSKELRTYVGVPVNYKLLIRAVVLATENYNYETLGDGKITLKIIEEYANGGAPILYDKIFKSGGISFSLEDGIWNQLKDVPK